VFEDLEGRLFIAYILCEVRRPGKLWNGRCGRFLALILRETGLLDAVTSAT